MRHKTLFRLVLKAIGVVAILYSGHSLLYAVCAMLSEAFFEDLTGFALPWTYLVPNAISDVLLLIAGLYLIFGGKLIADMAIPGNRHYCNECGYELRSAGTPECPECGTVRPHA